MLAGRQLHTLAPSEAFAFWTPRGPAGLAAPQPNPGAPSPVAASFKPPRLPAALAATGAGAGGPSEGALGGGAMGTLLRSLGEEEVEEVPLGAAGHAGPFVGRPAS